MSRASAYLLLAITFLTLAACGREARPTPTPTPTFQPIAFSTPRSPLPTPNDAAQQVSVSPLVTPTDTPFPLLPMPTPTPTALPLVTMYTFSGTPVAGLPIPADPLVVCMPQAEVFECYDELLDLRFSYPAFMGEIEYTTLRKGSWAGFGYEYIFDTRDSYAGGRSPDFSAARGPRYTDQTGFNGRSAQELCHNWVAMLCQELSPNMVLIGILPQAEWLCGDAMMFQRFPQGILVLDLPQHPLIKGFAFSFSFLSAERQAAFEGEWYANGRSCEPETPAELGAHVEQLHQALLAGTAEAEIQARYDAMIQLAESLESPYLALEP